MTTTISGTSGIDKVQDGIVGTAGLASSAVTSAKMASGAARTNFGAGAVLQVVSVALTAKTTVSVGSSSTFYGISGLSASITPSSTSSKILAFVTVVGSGTGGYGNLCAFQLWRAGSPVGNADSASGYKLGNVANQRASADANSSFSASFNYLDSPATTSSTTYQVACTVEAGNVVINATGNDNSGQVYSGRSASYLTLMEIAG